MVMVYVASDYRSGLMGFQEEAAAEVAPELSYRLYVVSVHDADLCLWFIVTVMVCGLGISVRCFWFSGGGGGGGCATGCVTPHLYNPER